MLLTAVLLETVCLRIAAQWSQSGLKTGGSWALKIQQTEAHRAGLRVSSPEFLFNYMQIFLFMKNRHFWKVFSSHVPVHYSI